MAHRRIAKTQCPQSSWLGGVTDKLLGDYANLLGDLSVSSGNNALSGDRGNRGIWS